MKKLMLGNEAVARGLFEAGVTFVSSYPGTPSTEISEEAAKYEEIYAEWAPNEKVAVEAALGASLSGARAFSAMKHVGLNVAADPLFTASYTGVNGGLVIAVADDMGMHSSQNEQDSRHYADAAKLPMLEPASSQECVDYVRAAYEMSESYDTPVLVRMSTRIAHSTSVVDTGERAEIERKLYEKNPAKYVMMPGFAIKKHTQVEARQRALSEYANSSPLNTIEHGGGEIGVIAAGSAYLYAKEALGDKASYLKLGMINPLPMELIYEFRSSVKKLYVIEELDDIFERAIRASGIVVDGGKALFSLEGEYTPAMIREKLLGETAEYIKTEEPAPARPPVLCPGCPHRGVFYTLSKLKLTVSGDIGCYTLGALPPMNALDTTVDMGASISMLHGMNKAGGEAFSNRSVAVIGDSTFIHSGITGLVHMVYNQSDSTVLILDNSITGMTGHQENPTTGKNLKGSDAPKTDIDALCKALGAHVRVIDPYDLKACESTITEELSRKGVSVIIARRPCALLKYVKAMPPCAVIDEKCKKCRACMKIGCPAISYSKDTGARIDPSICVGCGLCAKMCNFGAIVEAGREVHA